MIDGGTMYGSVGFSATTTKQNKTPGLLQSYADIENVFGSVQITPWTHEEVSLGVDGIGYSRGIDIGDTSIDFEIKGGWGFIALVASPTSLNMNKVLAY